MTDSRVAESYADVVLTAPTTPVLVTQVYAEAALVATTRSALVSQTYAEVLATVQPVSDLSPLATVSASSTGAGTSTANVLDGDLSTFWKSNGTVTNETIKQVFSVAQEVRLYRLAATDTVSQAPKTWKLQGSHDGSTWSDVDSQSNAPAWSARAVREYALAAGYTFEQWRIIWTSSQSDATAVGLSEWQLFPPPTGPATGATFEVFWGIPIR